MTYNLKSLITERCIFHHSKEFIPTEFRHCDFKELKKLLIFDYTIKEVRRNRITGKITFIVGIVKREEE